MGENSLDLLREHLDDPTCEVWFCPHCGYWVDFGFVNPLADTVAPFVLTCGECGFDATPYFIPEILTQGLPVEPST